MLYGSFLEMIHGPNYDWGLERPPENYQNILKCQNDPPDLRQLINWTAMPIIPRSPLLSAAIEFMDSWAILLGDANLHLIAIYTLLEVWNRSKNCTTENTESTEQDPEKATKKPRKKEEELSFCHILFQFMFSPLSYLPFKTVENLLKTEKSWIGLKYGFQ